MLKVYSAAVCVPHKVSVNQSYRAHSFCCGLLVCCSECTRAHVRIKKKGKYVLLLNEIQHPHAHSHIGGGKAVPLVKDDSEVEVLCFNQVT